MGETEAASKDSVVVLFKGGRLASWHALTEEDQEDYARQHIELMHSVAREHRLMHLEGFKLITPHNRWERFWVIEFPDMAGAEAWIDAEIAPPYGSYAYHDYFVARRWRRDYFAGWVATPPKPGRSESVHPGGAPALRVHRDSVIVLLFGRWLSEADSASPEERGDREHIELMRSVARDNGLMRLEAFRLVGLQNEWHRAWVIEFPTLEGAEAWIDAEVRPPHGRFANKDFHLARKWAPEHFATWVTG